MKSFLLSVAFLLTSTYTSAQIAPRMIRFRTIGRDSVNMSLNEDYYLIEDSCAAIIRYAHYDGANRKFFGHFKDVSKQNPALVLLEGNYTPDGLKDGTFISRYANGNLRSKGNYKNDQYDGTWEVNYDNDKPEIAFEATDGVIKILNVWNDKGLKTVDNGKGNYLVNLGGITWAGKLENGRPDGTWKAYRTDDATQATFIKESFKKGVFQKGSSSVMDYTNASRIIYFSQDMFPYVRAEKLMISATPCGGAKQKHLISAQYKQGISSFTEAIQELVTPYLSKLDLKNYNDHIDLEGTISEVGIIYNLQYSNPFNEPMARGLINQLRRLPTLEPATADGKPIKQNIVFTFRFNSGTYSFTYRFLPIKP
jgi:hypothetical protein